MKKNVNLWSLFLIFFKIGFFTFVGGYAMIPIFQREISTKRKWISPDEIIDLFTIAQSIPGAIAVNTSILIGYKLKKNIGAFVTTMGIVLPSYITITVIAYFFDSVEKNIYVQTALRGINAAVVALIVVACISAYKSGIKDKLGIILLAVSVITVKFLGLNPIYVILFGILLGIFIYFFFNSKMREKFDDKKVSDKEEHNE